MRLVVIAVVASFLLTIACSGPQQRDEELIEQSRYHFELAQGHYRASEIPVAIRELLTSLDLNPDNVDALFLLGFIHHGRREFAEAERRYARAVDLAPERYDIQNNLGTVFLEQSRWEEALEVYEDLISEPTYMTPGHAHNNLGWAHYNQGRCREALDHFDFAIMFQPDHCLAYNNRGLALECVGDVREASRAYEGAVERCATYQEPRYRLAMLLLQLDRQVERAYTLLEECNDIMPESDYGRRCLEWLSPDDTW